MENRVVHVKLSDRLNLGQRGPIRQGNSYPDGGPNKDSLEWSYGKGQLLTMPAFLRHLGP